MCRAFNADSGLPLCPSVYVHIPFCATRCDFCAFYEEAPRRSEIDRFLSGVEAEIRNFVRWNDAGALRRGTIFWGGGTPGVLPVADLVRLAEILTDQLIAEPLEWTVEMAPSTVKADKLAALRDSGVTRISLGAQSFDDATLQRIGRRQSSRQVLKAWESIQSAGFASTNIDLMFALPGQTQASWLQDLETAVGLGPDHLSTYCLTFEEDTRLYAQLSAGKLVRDAEAEADLYLETWRQFARFGFEHYEVSNFARPGHACLHNLNTWHMGDWIGFGPSAASQWKRRRFNNPPDMDAWLKQTLSGTLGEHPTLSDEDLATDALLFGLRLNRGVDFDSIQRRFPGWRPCKQLQRLIADLERDHLLSRSGCRLSLTDAGRLVADAVAVSILEAVERR